MSKPKLHSETAFVPMITRGDHSRFFFSATRRRMGGCRDAFCDCAKMGWPLLKKEGWRIVKVRIEVIR